VFKFEKCISANVQWTAGPNSINYRISLTNFTLKGYLLILTLDLNLNGKKPFQGAGRPMAS
jgi:hypothetical protein